jgi:DNA-binding response OmpR family regulator
MQNVLLIEDSKEYELMVTEVLKSRCHVICSDTIAKARVELAKREFAIIILDITLPDGDGFEFCSELQRHNQHKDIPVVLLTGRNQPGDKVLGWNTGADDYLEKPFNPFEFQARIDARIRKYQSKLSQDEILTKGALHLNIAYHEAMIVDENGERRLSLTRYEFKLLYHLIRNQDRVLSRRQLQHAVWGPLTHVTDRTIDKHISQLRQKLGPEARKIQTVSGMGYKFTMDRLAQSA